MSTRQATSEEIREEVFQHIESMIRDWEADHPAHPNASVRDKLEGLVFSILSMLDGDSMLPSFRIFPSGYKEDIEFFRTEGLNWYPINDGLEGEGEITDIPLHEAWCAWKDKLPAESTEAEPKYVYVLQVNDYVDGATTDEGEAHKMFAEACEKHRSSQYGVYVKVHRFIPGKFEGARDYLLARMVGPI